MNPKFDVNNLKLEIPKVNFRFIYRNERVFNPNGCALNVKMGL